MDWLPYLCIALVAVGVAALTAKALGRWSLTPLAVGLSGLISYATDFGDAVGLLLANIPFGVLFSLSWIVLGYALWRQGGGSPARASAGAGVFI